MEVQSLELEVSKVQTLECQVSEVLEVQVLDIEILEVQVSNVHILNIEFLKVHILDIQVYVMVFKETIVVRVSGDPITNVSETIKVLWDPSTSKDKVK